MSEEKMGMAAAAKDLRKALSSFMTDNTEIIKVIVPYNNEELQQLIEVYRKEIQRDLIPDIEKNCHGEFKKVLLAMFTAWDTYDAHQIRKAIAGLGTNEKHLTEIVCMRTPAELIKIGKKYEQEFQKNMIEAIKKDTGGHYQRLLLTVLTGEGRSHKGFKLDKDQVAKDVDALYAAGEKKWFTDEDTFIKIIAGQPRPHVEAVAVEYGMKYGRSFHTVLAKECGGDSRYAMQVLTTPLPEFYAEEFHHAMKGLGTDDTRLIRTLTESYHRCLRETTIRYLEMYKVSLKQAFNSETSGNYKKILDAIADHYTKKM